MRKVTAFFGTANKKTLLKEGLLFTTKFNFILQACSNSMPHS
ncbi:MAG: hypothetical protein JWR61_2544 [Ferruginibacter sp.]|jgi:hypothetical protein|nr:hypothetical protein [Ferruginibacter sp.]